MIVLSCDVTQILSGTKNALKMHLSSNTKRINQIPITIFWRTNTAKDKFCIYLTLKRYRIVPLKSNHSKSWKITITISISFMKSQYDDHWVLVFSQIP